MYTGVVKLGNARTAEHDDDETDECLDWLFGCEAIADADDESAWGCG